MKEKIKKILLFLITVGGLLSLSFYTRAHPGRTDAYGCHTCKTNCPSWGLSYGEYHCHRAKSLPQPEPPVKSHQEGYTEPAPEYEVPAQEYEAPKSKQLTAEIPKENGGGSVLGWIIGIGIVGYIFYWLKKRGK